MSIQSCLNCQNWEEDHGVVLWEVEPPSTHSCKHWDSGKVLKLLPDKKAPLLALRASGVVAYREEIARQCPLYVQSK